jgi:hypothetical protein
VEDRRHPQVDEPVLADPDALADGDGQDADVDRVVVGVLVVAAQVREPEQVRLRGEELVDHRLHDPFRALEPQRLAQLHVVHDVGDDFHRLRVDPLGALLRVLVIEARAARDASIRRAPPQPSGQRARTQSSAPGVDRAASNQALTPGPARPVSSRCHLAV